jgi:hypothetical protein
MMEYIARCRLSDGKLRKQNITRHLNNKKKGKLKEFFKSMKERWRGRHLHKIKYAERL